MTSFPFNRNVCAIFSLHKKDLPKRTCLIVYLNQVICFYPGALPKYTWWGNRWRYCGQDDVKNIDQHLGSNIQLVGEGLKIGVQQTASSKGYNR